MPRGQRAGFTLVELALVIGILVVVSVVMIPNLVGKRSRNELDATTRRIVTLLREAQSRSVSEVSGKSWGVHFDNNANTSFFALFGASYASNTEEIHIRLPASVRFASSSIPVGNSRDVVFARTTGAPGTTTSITLELGQGTASATTATSTITISVSGVIGF